MTIFARLYEHANFDGRSSFHILSSSPLRTLKLVPKSALDTLDMNDQTSSLTITATVSEKGGFIILFQNPSYQGRYAMFPCTPGQTNETSQLSSIDFDERTSSAMLVRRFTNECPPIPISNLLGSSFKEAMQDSLGSIDVSIGSGRFGTVEDVSNLEPIYTWDILPDFSPSRMYIYVRMPCKMVLESWFDYDFEARLWIYLYIDRGGILRGYVDWYGVWVEGGILSDNIADALMRSLAFTAGSANRPISEALGAWESISFRRLYYLPGRDDIGHVNDGVRLVLVTEL
jgi:hypothetical protein